MVLLGFMADYTKLKESCSDVKKRINFEPETKLEEVKYTKQHHNRSMFIFYFMTMMVLTVAVLCQLYSSNICKQAASQTTLLLTSWHRKLQDIWIDSLKSRLKVSEYLPSILHAGGLGTAVTLFSWIITYYDSSLPGIQPPTPLSPRIIRVKSGHNFHMGYILALVNGILCSFMALWWL